MWGYVWTFLCSLLTLPSAHDLLLLFTQSQAVVQPSNLQIPQRNSGLKSKQGEHAESDASHWLLFGLLVRCGDCHYVAAVRFQRNRCRLPVFLSNESDSNFDKKRHAESDALASR